MASDVIRELSPKERLEYTKTVLRARQDPIWFMKEILEWKTMWPKQEEIIRNFYQNRYDPSLQEYKELAIIAGQRAGKSVIVGNLTAYAFHELISYENPSEHFGLMKNQPIAVTCVAVSKDQALDGIFSLMQTALQESEWINHHYDLTFHSDGRIDCYDKNCFALVRACRADTLAGASNAFIALDELDLFQNNTVSKIAAENVFRKLVNSTMTFGNAGKIVSISSLDHTNGMMARVHYDATQKANALAYKLCTWEINPNPEVSEERLREEYKYNMEAFWRYFANRPDVSSTMMFPGGVRLNSTILNLLQTDIKSIDDEIKDIPRVIAIDPAVKNDSFGMSFGWRKSDYLRIDGAIKYEKPGEKDAFIKPSDIKNIIKLILDEMNIIGFVHDTYQYPEILEMVEYDYGLPPIQHHADAEAYGKWLEIQEGASPLRLDVVYDEHLRRECEQLTKERLPSGKIRIDHPANGCFIGETRIKLFDGSCPTIEELTHRTSPFLVCSSTSEGEIVSGKAIAKLTKYTNKLVDVVMASGAIIRCTPEHRFMLINGEYKEIQNINPHIDRIMPCNISHEPVKEGCQILHIIPVILNDLVPVYDLEVEKWHNFALMAGIIVHNSKDIADPVSNCIWYLDANMEDLYGSFKPIGSLAIL